MDEPQHIPDTAAAVRTILRELDRAYESQMMLVDVVEDIQAGAYRLNDGKLREVAARRLRESVERRDAAVRVLERGGI